MIYAPYDCPVMCARALDDRLLYRSIMQISSVLKATVHFGHAIIEDDSNWLKWCARTQGNFQWLCNLGLAATQEYAYRFEAPHCLREDMLISLAYKNVVPPGDIQPADNATKYKHTPTNIAYRLALQDEWRNNRTTFTRRTPPDWFATNFNAVRIADAKAEYEKQEAARKETPDVSKRKSRKAKKRGNDNGSGQPTT